MFGSASNGTDALKDLEEEINKWLEEHQSLKICKFLQTYGNGATYVSIIYKIGI